MFPKNQNKDQAANNGIQSIGSKISKLRLMLFNFEGTPLEMDLRSVMDQIADSLQGHISGNLKVGLPEAIPG
jgi:hypothetical protein